MIKLSETLLKNAPKKIEVGRPMFENVQFIPLDENQVRKIELKKQIEETDKIFFEMMKENLIGSPPDYQEVQDLKTYQEELKEIIEGL